MDFKPRVLNILLKPSSSKCNLKCPYCFYNDLSEVRSVKDCGFMSVDLAEKIIEEMFAKVHESGEINIAFQGGEPTMIGLEFYKKFVKRIEGKLTKYNEIKVNYLIQTNGTLINESWADFFKKNKFLVGLSIDGDKNNTDHFRVNKNGKGQYDNILYAFNLLKKNNVDYSIISVLTEQLSKKPEEYYNFLRENEIEHVQIIPCIPDLDGERTYFDLTPESYNSFYSSIFDLWYTDYINKIKPINILLFNDIIPMYSSIRPSQCGMLGMCNPQIIVEADGSVYPCDFYALDEYKIGNLKDNSLNEIMKSRNIKKFILADNKKNEICLKCPFQQICGGNCKKQNQAFLTDEYCGYKEFLNYTEKRMRSISRQLFGGIPYEN